MKKLTTSQLRKAYLDFFVSKGHSLVKSDSLVPLNDPSVLFTSAGMNQFKDNFLGNVKDLRRATSCQKCLRTGDLEEVGRTPFHHTFFEMLGNFSFGDYFKREAIEWGWEFVTGTLEIDAEKLWVSVYEDDSEAFDLWHKHMNLPLEKIKKLGQKDNFWPSNAIKDGPNGPCGPCSEIYYKKESGESVEVWNLVFTQFNRLDGGVLEPLPNKNIDTGMGLERISAVLQGVDSNFEIDIFRPIIDSVKKSVEAADLKSVYKIADHARAVVFSICDGVLPSNEGRGYVIRKLIRRASSYSSSKKARPFLYKIVSSIAESMGDQYPELLERRDNIAQIIKAEEEKYIKNILEGGNEKLDEIIKEYKETGDLEVSARVVAQMYMTHGIPVDSTREALDKAGLSVNSAAALEIIKQEQDRTRETSKMSASIFSSDFIDLKDSEFVGYEADFCEARILQIIRDGKSVEKIDTDAAYGIVLDRTPFYGESGGQVGDKGYIQIKGNNFKLKVEDTKKDGNSIIHLVSVEGLSSGNIKVADIVEARVDKDYREGIRRSHTATHILQAVLRKVLREHVRQAGSFVEPDRFRFDFHHFKDISAEDLERIQDLLNEYILRNDRLSAQVMKKEDAKKTGATALFSEKYDDLVRVVSVGDYSKEFCGGTHIDFTGKIGVIFIISESSVGSGLRRIEALTGKLAYQEAKRAFSTLFDAADRLKTRPEQVVVSLDQLINKARALEKEAAKFREKDAADQSRNFVLEAPLHRKIKMVVQKIAGLEANLLRQTVDKMKEQVPDKGVFVLAAQNTGNIPIVCACTPDLVKAGFDSGALLKKISLLVGGSGGGRKDFAQGGTKDISSLNNSWAAIQEMVKQEIDNIGDIS